MKILFARNKDNYNIHRERKAMFKVKEKRREREREREREGGREREKEKKSAIEMERSGNEVASVHPSPYSLPPLTTPLHINPPLLRVESIARACV
ncbi:hypothetical protein ALC56_13486 [Trachymyrmex septentrionalis]|uniref:Uncharacterized protein n=1 Tax=Trachymyrmex septentrionalis TaxID=34720 RepID=A0A195EV35_9HYME|nr:hypothetical protein ALC56_13486 [Trachymyrmex septentrionalis]